MKAKHVSIIVLLILILDQSLKIWIKTTMEFDTHFYPVHGMRWFRIHFIENPGMAFGLELGGQYGKLALSLFRIIAIAFIIYVIKQLIDQRYPKGLIICASMILAGALGNMIDSAFYGMIFTDSYGRVAAAFAAEGGYGGFLQGKVVDMLYFPIKEIHLPSWVPVIGDESYLFFRPIFNIADSSITVGVFIILLFQKRLLLKPVDKIPVKTGSQDDIGLSDTISTISEERSQQQ